MASAAEARNLPPNDLAPLFPFPLWFFGYQTRRLSLEFFEKSREAVPLMDDPEQQKRAIALLDMHTGRVLYKLGRFEQARRPAGAAWEFFETCDREEVNKALSSGRLGLIRRQLRENAGDLLPPALATFERLGMTKQADEIRAVLNEA